jgi:hypothetical protein
MPQIAPTLLAERLHVTNHAVAGAIFYELATVVTGMTTTVGASEGTRTTK